jgi:hypothetical protein
MSNATLSEAWRSGGGFDNPAGDIEAELGQMFAAQRHAQQRATVSSVTRVCSGTVSCCA